MDLKARKKQKRKEIESIKSSVKEVGKESSQAESKSYAHPITIQCNTLLYTTMQNMIKAFI